MRQILLRATTLGTRGSTAAEFALVLPVLIFFLFGIIDAGRFMWTLNQTEKATQMGVRIAVVTDMVPGGLYSMDYSASLGQGAPIPTSSFGAAQCQKPASSVTCSCTTTPCPTLTPVNSVSFSRIATLMSNIAPIVQPQNIRISYTNSGLGYAGDPNGADIAPIVTVTATGIRFTSLVLFGKSINLPDITASLTTEDSFTGTETNWN